jgi:hypothetical protein
MQGSFIFVQLQICETGYKEDASEGPALRESQ